MINHRALFSFGVCVVLAVGCTPARYAGSEERSVAHGSLADVGVTVPSDTGSSRDPDDASAPADDAWVAPEDAWNPPGHDAGVVSRDAWVAPTPDAWTMPACPTYAGTVRALYAMHCANCHTTGSDPRFGSSYSVANETTSSCGGSMAACTIQLGSPGGSMARRDSLGGFNTTEIATLQSWIACGRPM